MSPPGISCAGAVEGSSSPEEFAIRRWLGVRKLVLAAVCAHVLFVVVSVVVVVVVTCVVRGSSGLGLSGEGAIWGWDLLPVASGAGAVGTSAGSILLMRRFGVVDRPRLTCRCICSTL